MSSFPVNTRWNMLQISFLEKVENCIKIVYLCGLIFKKQLLNLFSTF